MDYISNCIEKAGKPNHIAISMSSLKDLRLSSLPHLIILEVNRPWVLPLTFYLALVEIGLFLHEWMRALLCHVIGKY